MTVLKKVIWLGNSLKNLKSFSNYTQRDIGYTLDCIQQGEMPDSVKILKGFKPTVMEIISDHDKNTYRLMYTAKVAEVIYVLHCFQKKSKTGIETPKQDMDLIKQRLREALKAAKEL